MNLSSKKIGFLGCGKISSAVCRGYCSLDEEFRPSQVMVSQRSREKSALLKNDHPELITVCESNEDIVNNCDIIFIGLLPDVAREILPLLPFNENHFVISMMAAIDYSETVSLLKISSNRVVKTVPLPSAAKRSGPILAYPINPLAEDILKNVGTPVMCNNETNMKPLISIAGHISSFFELMRVTQDWAIKNGVEKDTSRQFVTSFYSSLSKGAESSEDTLEYLCEEAATPGGLNEQSLKFLRESDHYEMAEKSLELIFQRLMGGKK